MRCFYYFASFLLASFFLTLRKWSPLSLPPVGKHLADKRGFKKDILFCCLLFSVGKTWGFLHTRHGNTMFCCCRRVEHMVAAASRMRTLLFCFCLHQQCSFFRHYPVLQWRLRAPCVPARLDSDAFDSIACMTWCSGMRQYAKGWVLCRMVRLFC